MSLYERIGVASIRVVRKVVYYILTLLIIILKSFKKINLYRFFKEKVDFIDYLILKYQLTVIFMIGVVFLYISNVVSSKAIVVPLEIIASAYGLLIVLSIKNYTDYRPYRDILIIYGIIIAFLILAKGINMIIYATVAILLTVVAFLYFTKYYRDYTFGKVLEVGKYVKVKVHYDICAGVKPGIYHVKKPDIEIKPGDKVKLFVRRKFLRKSEIVEIVDVEGE